MQNVNEMIVISSLVSNTNNKIVYFQQTSWRCSAQLVMKQWVFIWRSHKSSVSYVIILIKCFLMGCLVVTKILEEAKTKILFSIIVCPTVGEIGENVQTKI